MRLAFGECVFDGETRELRRGAAAVHLPAKAFRLLEVLLEQRPKAVSKAALMEAVWPDVLVIEGNLTRLVAELRGAIGDEASDPRFIRTVHGFGYAFSAEARSDRGPPGAPEEVVFKLLWADREIALRSGENVLGREREAAAWIDVHSVSRRHARILVAGEVATLEDLGSKNGTFLGDEAVTAPRLLSDGDRIRVGTVEMTLRRYRGGLSTESVRR
jgi:DNA-binding winged helix-turn-helix (wHTH) protein